MTDNIIDPIPERVTASEREFILAYRSLPRDEQEKFLKEFLEKYPPKKKEFDTDS